MTNLLSTFTALAQAHPEVATIVVFLIVLGFHIAVGCLVHLVRLHDFDWHRLGKFVEDDFATKRGLAILVTFLMTLVTTTVPNQDVHAAFGPAFAALVLAAGASVLPILRDTLYELVYLVSGQEVAPAAQAAKVSATIAALALFAGGSFLFGHGHHHHFRGGCIAGQTGGLVCPPPRHD